LFHAAFVEDGENDDDDYNDDYDEEGWDSDG